MLDFKCAFYVVLVLSVGVETQLWKSCTFCNSCTHCSLLFPFLQETQKL